MAAGIHRGPRFVALPATLWLGVLLEGLDPTMLGFRFLIVFGVPIAHARVLGAYAALQADELPDVIIASYFAGTMASNFVLLAISFFVLMGAFMNAGGVM